MTRRITAVESVTLDGVVQAPGAIDEDVRGGFAHGGWAAGYQDEVQLREMSKGFGRSDLLFGRFTYDTFRAYWPTAPRPNPFSDLLDATTKYVVSRTLAEPLPWVNSVLLSGDAVEGVRAVRETAGNDLVILGSGELVRSLLRHGLLDGFTLLVHPLVLGSGTRLFGDDGPTGFRLVTSIPTTTGVVISTYERNGSPLGSDR